MKRIILGLALIAVLGLCGCSKLRAYFANGQEEMQKAFQAKAAAKSFSMTTKIAAHEDNTMETHFYVSCPDRERITMKISSQNREMIRIGQRFYLNQDGTWYYKDVGVKDWSPCGNNPGLPSPWALLTEGRDMVSIFAAAKDKFKVEPAAAIEYNGKKYNSVWTVSMDHQGVGSPFKYTVLLDENRRPAVVAVGRTSVTEYSDWNKPLTIEAPANAVPFPENVEQAAPANPSMVHGH